MKSIAVFNNKGGVGKTTLACNLASFFAIHLRKRVLLIDCDSQCNSTQLVLGNKETEEIYWRSNQGGIETIYNVMQPIIDGDSDISKDIPILSASSNRFGIDLIAGHPSFSLVEDNLGAAWHEMQANVIGGIRKTNWNTSLLDQIEHRYDYVFFDLGPSLGSINRSILIGCDFFISPMGSDIFSVYGIRNIDLWLSGWMMLYDDKILNLKKIHGERLSLYPINQELKIKHGFAGYTMQQYITKSKQGVRRPTKAYEGIINSVPDEVGASVMKYAVPGLKIADARIGDIPHLYSLIPLAQSVASPILEINNRDKIFGAQIKQKEEYGQILSGIATNLLKNIGED